VGGCRLSVPHNVADLRERIDRKWLSKEECGQAVPNVLSQAFGIDADMDFEVPLNRLKFGQGAGMNTSVTDINAIARLAANIHAHGQIENLIVEACGDEFYSVSDGNLRLAAFHMIYSANSTEPIRCTLREVDGALELDAVEAGDGGLKTARLRERLPHRSSRGKTKFSAPIRDFQVFQGGQNGKKSGSH